VNEFGYLSLTNSGLKKRGEKKGKISVGINYRTQKGKGKGEKKFEWSRVEPLFHLHTGERKKGREKREGYWAGAQMKGKGGQIHSSGLISLNKKERRKRGGI